MKKANRRANGTIGFVVLTLCLILVSAFCFTGTVISQNKPSEKEMENYYRAQEKELVQETRDYLNQAGFSNSGVTLTRVIDADGSREYTVTVHHSKIDKMDMISRANLKEELATLAFAADNCTFCHEFLVTD